MIVDRVCYATREEVRRSLDVKNAAYNGEQIDRQILSISDDIDKMCARVFFPQDATRYFDWPNFQYAFPWRLWLNRHESAITPLTQFMSGGILVPTTDYILRPENSGPPYTYIEMRRDRNSVFSSTTTPQQAVVITTTFGYWNKLLSAGTLATTVNNSITTVQVSNGSAVGVGDMISVEGERMIVQDKMAITTGVPLTGGLATASNQDNTFNVPDIALFAVGEVLLVDSERLLIVDMLPNTLVVKRGWDGTLLAAHTSATIYALRGLTVSRGELGTAAAAHTSQSPFRYWPSQERSRSTQ